MLLLACSSPAPSAPTARAQDDAHCEIAAALRREAGSDESAGRLYRAIAAIERADALCPQTSAETAALRRSIEEELASARGARALFGEGLVGKRSGDDAGAQRAFDRALAALERETGEKVRLELRPALASETGPRPPIEWSPDSRRYLERATLNVVDPSSGVAHAAPAEGVRAVALVADSEGVAIRDFDGKAPVELLDFESGLSIGNLGVAGLVRRVAVTDDGRMFAIVIAAAGSRDVLVWDSARKARAFLVPAREGVAELAFSADGRTLWVTDGDQVAWCDVQKGPPCRATAGRLLATSARVAAVATKRGIELQVMHAAGGKPALRLAKSACGEATRAAFDAKGERFAIADAENRVCLWDAATGRIRANFPSVDATISGLEVAADGRVLATAVADTGHHKSYVLIPTKTTTAEPEGERYWAGGGRASFFLDRNRWTIAVATEGSAEQTVPLPRNQTPILRYLAHRFSPDAHWLWVDGVTVDVGAARIASSLPFDELVAPLFAAASGSLWTVSFPRLVQWQREKSRPARTLAIPKQANRVLFDAAGAPMFVWVPHVLPKDAPTFAEGDGLDVFRPLLRYGAEIRYLDASRVAARQNPGVILTALADGAQASRYLRVPEFYGFAASPDGTQLATTDSDAVGAAHIWDSRTGQSRAELKGRARFLDIAFSPDGKSVVTLSSTGSLDVWDISAGCAKSRSFDARRGETLARRGLVFSTDGRFIASRSEAGFRIWNVTDGSEVADIAAPRATEVLGFSRDRRRLWMNTGGRLVAAPIDATGTTASIVAPPDGKALVVLASDGRFTIVGDRDSGRRQLACRAGRWSYPLELCEARFFDADLWSEVAPN